MNKILTILKSRFKKESDEKWIKERKEVCKKCPFNSLNTAQIPLKGKLLIKLSNLYNIITFSKPEKLGNCTACDFCDIYYKSAEKEEECPKNKWKKL